MLTALFVTALILCGLCALLSWVFVARHARTGWTASHGGRYLMRSKIAMALLFTFTTIAQLVPMRPATAGLLSVLLFAWTAFVLGDLLLMQSRGIRRAKDDRAKADELERMTRDRLDRLRGE